MIFQDMLARPNRSRRQNCFAFREGLPGAVQSHQSCHNGVDQCAERSTSGVQELNVTICVIILIRTCHLHDHGQIDDVDI